MTAAVSALVLLLGVYFLVWTAGGWDTEDEIAQKEKARARGEDPEPDKLAPGVIRKLFPQKKINLGLDLQGGIDLVLGVGVADAVEVAAERAMEGVVEGLVREGIETVLFLSAAVFTSSPVQTLTGGLVGLLRPWSSAGCCSRPARGWTCDASSR